MAVLLGNDSIIEQLRVAAVQNKTAHAYLICGAPGMGKKTLAKEICRMVMCPQNGCGECRTCMKIEKGIHPDIKVLVGEGKSGQIKVDMIRELRKDAYIRPGEAEKKVYIIDGAQMMNPDAQNAFLKVLEEPPEAVMFLLLCTAPDMLLQTVLSRVIRINLLPAPTDQAVVCVAQKSGKAQETCRQALDICGGNIGKALSLVQMEDVGEKVASCEAFCKAIAEQNNYYLASFLHQQNESSEQFCSFCSLLCLYLRQLYRLQQTGEEPTAFGKSILQNKALFCTIKKERLLRIIQAFQKAIGLRKGFISSILIETQLVCTCKE